MISTGGTLAKAAEALIKRGATKVVTCATHGIFAGDAVRVLNESAIERVIVTNSLPNTELELGPKFKVLSIAQILADAIKRITANRSVSELFAREEDAPTQPSNVAAADAGASGTHPSPLESTVNLMSTNTTDSLNAVTRDGIGTTAVKHLREEGKTPAVLFGHGAPPLPLALEAKAFLELMKASGGKNRLLNLTIDGKPGETALVREVQRDPVSRRIVHVDLQRVGASEQVSASLPIVTLGIADGVKSGGGVMDLVRARAPSARPGQRDSREHRDRR